MIHNGYCSQSLAIREANNPNNFLVCNSDFGYSKSCVTVTLAIVTKWNGLEWISVMLVFNTL